MGLNQSVKKALSLQSLPPIEDLIRDIRGRRVLLDADLAAIYGVTTAALNQAVKRNEARFPADFSFQLSDGEIKTLISQNVISKPARGGRTKPPRVFTEYGALQAANVLRSKRAVAMSLPRGLPVVLAKCAHGRRQGDRRRKQTEAAPPADR
jgi:hypothetical protein